ncbi:hypothetical protein JCM10213_001789 [Rhodosporidiobolus nylandii]
MSLSKHPLARACTPSPTRATPLSESRRALRRQLRTVDSQPERPQSAGAEQRSSRAVRFAEFDATPGEKGEVGLAKSAAGESPPPGSSLEDPLDVSSLPSPSIEPTSFPSISGPFLPADELLSPSYTFSTTEAAFLEHPPPLFSHFSDWTPTPTTSGAPSASDSPSFTSALTSSPRPASPFSLLALPSSTPRRVVRRKQSAPGLLELSSRGPLGSRLRFELDEEEGGNEEGWCAGATQALRAEAGARAKMVSVGVQATPTRSFGTQTLPAPVAALASPQDQGEVADGGSASPLASASAVRGEAGCHLDLGSRRGHQHLVSASNLDDLDGGGGWETPSLAR